MAPIRSGGLHKKIMTRKMLMSLIQSQQPRFSIKQDYSVTSSVRRILMKCRKMLIFPMIPPQSNLLNNRESGSCKNTFVDRTNFLTGYLEIPNFGERDLFNI